MLDSAKNRALLEGRIFRVTFDQDKRTFILLGKDGDEESPLRVLSVPAGIGVSLEPSEVLFYPDATLQPFTLSLSDSQGRVSRCTSQGFDGSITLEREEKP